MFVHGRTGFGVGPPWACAVAWNCGTAKTISSETAARAHQARTGRGYTEIPVPITSLTMKMSKTVSLFLLGFGVWSWVIWVTFARNLWKSDNARDADGALNSFFYVHASLTVVSIILGTIIGVIGWRGLRAARREG